MVLPKEETFDRILIQEPIEFGQRVSQFEIDIFDFQQWKNIFKGTTIGCKRILRIPKVKTNKIRLRITAANNTVAISNFGLFKSSPNEK